ncbi:MAG: hypothetical protein AAB906_02245 [Patescibacteria group bacterium]
MEINEFFKLIGKRKQTIFAIVLLFVFVASVLTLIQPLRYESRSKLLVLQDFGDNFDPYSAAKSNEYLSNLLARITTSEVFFEEMADSGFNVDGKYFSDRADKKLKIWEKTVVAKAFNDSGIISVNIYHTDRYQTEQIARAVNYVLKTKNSQFYAGGSSVNIKVIDEPIVSKWPVKPNAPLNIGFAVILGFISGLFYIYILPDEKYSLRILPKPRNRIEYSKVEENISVPDSFERGSIRNVAG